MLAIEVGGSSVQATLFTNDGTFRIVPHSSYKDQAWAFAAPGLVDGDRVRGAHHTGWMDVLASEELGMITPPLLGMNDADASSLGEWVLQGEPQGQMFYVVMGTGIGATMVLAGGMNARYPQIRERLARSVSFPVLATNTPAGWKSAAPFGLRFQMSR